MFIVIDGTDGSGKATQCKKLIDYLEARKLPVAFFDFPRYGQPSAMLIELYLNGHFGRADEVPAKLASAFFAFDRFMAKPDMEKALAEGMILVANRYVSSNMGHQGSKFRSSAERAGFFRWCQELEYGKLKLPKPDISIFLHVPFWIGKQLVGKKDARSYTKETHDIHESDDEHLKNAEEAYMQMSKQVPGWVIIECTRNSSGKQEMKSVDEIHKEIVSAVEKTLSENPLK